MTHLVLVGCFDGLSLPTEEEVLSQASLLFRPDSECTDAIATLSSETPGGTAHSGEFVRLNSWQLFGRCIFIVDDRLRSIFRLMRDVYRSSSCPTDMKIKLSPQHEYLAV